MGLDDYFGELRACRGAAAGGDIRCAFNTNNSEISCILLLLLHRQKMKRAPSICRDNYRRRLLLHQVYILPPAEIVCLTSEQQQLVKHQQLSSRPILMVFSQSSTTHIDSLCIHTHYIDVRVCVCVCRQL